MGGVGVKIILRKIESHSATPVSHGVVRRPTKQPYVSPGACLFNIKNLAGSAASAEVRVLLSAVLGTPRAS